MIVLLLGSAPAVTSAKDWPRHPFDRVVAVNNAWLVRNDWDLMLHPEDFPPERRPQTLHPGQRIVTADEYVPANNACGGVIYAGATMAFSAGYWALEALKPRVLAYFGCDMVYQGSRTHFYGTGTADPLRRDPTLQDLYAKSARLELIAAQAGCAVVNLSQAETRLSFARATRAGLPDTPVPPVHRAAVARALAAEARLAAYCPSGRYWEDAAPDAPALARIDALWCDALRASRAEIATARAAG